MSLIDESIQKYRRLNEPRIVDSGDVLLRGSYDPFFLFNNHPLMLNNACVRNPCWGDNIPDGDDCCIDPIIADVLPEFPAKLKFVKFGNVSPICCDISNILRDSQQLIPSLLLNWWWVVLDIVTYCFVKYLRHFLGLLMQHTQRYLHSIQWGFLVTSLYSNYHFQLKRMWDSISSKHHVRIPVKDTP